MRIVPPSTGFSDPLGRKMVVDMQLWRKMVKIRIGMFSWIVFCIIGIVCVASNAIADILLLGTTSNGDSGKSTLVELDIGDGTQVESIGDVGYLVNGMAWDATTRTLYASTSSNDVDFNGLIIIDEETGEGAPVDDGTTDWGQAAGYSISNITIDSDGNIYGWADDTDELVTIDKDTGEATVLAAGIAAIDLGLSFDKIDSLFLIDSTGDLYVFADDDTFHGPGGDNDTTARHGDFHTTSNIYYGINNTGTDTRELVIVDVYRAAENLQETIETIDQLHTLAFIVKSRSSSNGDGGSCFIRSALMGL
jgi:hypothetical protein